MNHYGPRTGLVEAPIDDVNKPPDRHNSQLRVADARARAGLLVALARSLVDRRAR